MSTHDKGEVNSALSPDFLDFIACLNERDVDYVLIGGYALGVHGVVRATGDIDFLYRCTQRNVHRLCTALDDFGAPTEVIDETALATPGIVTQFGQPPYRIDLLNKIDGVTFVEVWKGSTNLTIGGQDIRVMGLSELRTNKAATGRPKDDDDLRRLRALSRRERR